MRVVDLILDQNCLLLRGLTRIRKGSIRDAYPELPSSGFFFVCSDALKTLSLTRSGQVFCKYRSAHGSSSYTMQPLLPSATPTWCNDTYAAISPARPKVSASGKRLVITGTTTLPASMVSGLSAYMASKIAQTKPSEFLALEHLIYLLPPCTPEWSRPASLPKVALRLTVFPKTKVRTLIFLSFLSFSSSVSSLFCLLHLASIHSKRTWWSSGVCMQPI